MLFTKSAVPDIVIAITDEDVEAVQQSATGTPEWKPSVHELLIMGVLSTISLMVSLDACIIVTSLSVSTLIPPCSIIRGTTHTKSTT